MFCRMNIHSSPDGLYYWNPLFIISTEAISLRSDETFIRACFSCNHTSNVRGRVVYRLLRKIFFMIESEIFIFFDKSLVITKYFRISHENIKSDVAYFSIRRGWNLCQVFGKLFPRAANVRATIQSNLYLTNLYTADELSCLDYP